MEVTYSLLSAISKPSFLSRHADLDRELIEDAQDTKWEHSPLNPQKRIDHLDATSCGWRIDGANILGRQLYAVPTSLLPDLVPSSVFVYLPSERDIPKELRYALDYPSSVVLRHGPHVARTGLSAHVCRALHAHCLREPQFLDTYQKLPFGSQLIFDMVCADPSQMRLEVAPNYDFERRTRSIAALKEMWSNMLSPEQWPSALDVNSLRLKRVLHDSVCVVEIAGCSVATGQEFVFKSSIGDLPSLYKELQFLLTCKPHRHIMPKPLYVVTKKQAFGGKRGVYGFILPYYPRGSMRDILPQKMLNKHYDLSLRLKWIGQLTAALLHVQEECRSFYSDLRPDNILIADNGDLVLIDFEQRGNWYEWCAPEIRHRMYTAHLVESGATQGSARSAQEETTRLASQDPVLQLAVLPAAQPETLTTQTTRNAPWLVLSTAAREQAMVFSLGLMMYCICEGTCNPKVSLTNAWPYEPRIEFPHFQRTPVSMQRIVKWCTSGAPEWNSCCSLPAGSSRIRRVHDHIVLAQPSQAHGVVQTPGDILQDASAAWEEEFRMRQGSDSRSCLGSDRPTLRELMKALDTVAQISNLRTP